MKICGRVKKFIRRKRPRDVWTKQEEEIFLQYFVGKEKIILKNIKDNIKNKH